MPDTTIAPNIAANIDQVMRQAALGRVLHRLDVRQRPAPGDEGRHSAGFVVRATTSYVGKRRAAEDTQAVPA